MMNTLYHYTTLESLAHILSSKSIMLRTITEMDDLQEDLGDVFSYGRYVFVSSWLREKTESIAMWKLYAGMENGVRIEMRQNPFRRYKVRANDVMKLVPNIVVEGEVDFVMPLEQWVNKGVFLPKADPDKILEKVEYVDNPRELNKDAVAFGKNQIIISSDNFGRYKSRYWEFQNEERYVLRFFPIDLLKATSSVSVAEDAVKAFMGPSKMPKQIFLEIDDSAFADMKITLSPMFTEGNHILIKALKDKYNPSMQLFDSELKNKIRL